ncbi:MAG: hypothetical protein IJK18_09410 [Clostridia bacterium]|nr:hypothetical protein [Clostridia bacterium]
MTIAIIIILVFIIAVLTIYNMSIHTKIHDFQSLHQKVINLNIIQDFINIAGSDIPVNNKIKEINNVIIDKYEVKYSTIVLFDGANYVIRATNVDQKHWDTLSSLHELDIFKDSIETTNPKYITVNNERERLPYQKSEFGRAKSAVFFPLYIDNIYIGYWLIESGTPHDFDNIDITVFETAKENMISAMKSVNYQKTLESLVRKDLFSGLNSAEYLYGNGKKIIDQYVSSAICMFKIANIVEINNISRELGNKTITKISEFIKRSISDSYIFVRYMGPKFVIVFCGVDANSASNFINELKESVERLDIKLEEKNFTVQELEAPVRNRKKKKKQNISVSPNLSFVVSTYYKGTGIETVLKSLETYLDDESHNINEINSI